MNSSHQSVEQSSVNTSLTLVTRLKQVADEMRRAQLALTERAASSVSEDCGTKLEDYLADIITQPRERDRFDQVIEISDENHCSTNIV